MRYVQFDPFGGCWLWDSGVTKNRTMEYPIFTLRVGKQQRVNRFMWEHHNGPIPKGLIVRHTCDVSLCVNPAHLLIGTHIDNATDRDTRGRGNWEGHVDTRSHCANGHLWTPQTEMYFNSHGSRHCRTCAQQRNRDYRARKKAARH